MSDELEVSVVLDRVSGLVIKKTVPRGSTIRLLKEALADDDPTGQTRPEDLALAPPGVDHGPPLCDDALVDEALGELVLATPAEPAAESEVSGAAAADTGGRGVAAIASATGPAGGTSAMQHVLARTRPQDLPSLNVAREVYSIINCADENGLDYDDYEEYAEALEQYWTDAIVEEGVAADEGPEDLPGALFDEVKYNEGRLFKARGDLLEKQQNELMCRQYLKMLQETMEYPWVPGEGVKRPQDEDGFEPVEIGEDGVPVRKAMRTGYVDSLMGGLSSDLDRYVDVRKIWCLSEKAAHIGQARKELIESVLTAHAADVRGGGKGLLIEKHRLGRPAASGAISLEDIRKELDQAFEAKLTECTEELPRLAEEVARAQKVCEDRQRDIDRLRREREEQLASQRATSDAEASARFDRELAEWREECRQADLREAEERSRREQAAEAARKAVHDAARRRCLLERFGQ